MKKVSLILSALMIAMMLTSCGGITTNEVIIGKQVWMTQNLNVDKFINGDPIPEAKTDEEWERQGENKQPAWCYYNNDPSNAEKYGKLYNWYAVNDSRGLAPTGYHIPNEIDWKILIDYLGGRVEAGKKMKRISGWSKIDDGTIRDYESGFAGLPGGGRRSNGVFGEIGKYSVWWSSTSTNKGNNAWMYNLDDDFDDDLDIDEVDKGSGISIRCLRD